MIDIQDLLSEKQAETLTELKNRLKRNARSDDGDTLSEVASVRTGFDEQDPATGDHPERFARYQHMRMEHLRDWTLLDAVIVFVRDDGPKWEPVCGKYDTGSDENFIRREILNRADAESLLEPFEGEVFAGLDRQEVAPTHRVWLTWHDSRGGKSRRTRFYLVEDAPFDIILGNPHIQEEQILQRQFAALPLRRKPKTAGEYIFTEQSSFWLL